MKELTVHCVVRNEPFVYYAVKSVYEYADVILLYDTGSDDVHTLKDIQQIISEDEDDKIIFKQIQIDVDATKWNEKTSKVISKQNRRKLGVEWVRQKMIDDTNTEFFMILDGDEVHYKAGMEHVIKTIQFWPEGSFCGRIPLWWFKSINHVFHQSTSGRLFVTDKVQMDGTPYPLEMHVVKGTGEALLGKHKFFVPEMIPYAHFETYLKPWRRIVENDINITVQFLPEVMEENTHFIRRFENESRD